MSINSILKQFLMEESSTACFKVRFSATSTKDFRIFLLFDDRLNENPGMYTIVLNSRQFGGPQMLGAPAIWPEWPSSERA